MNRSVALGLLCLSMVLVLAPLVAIKPGMPATLKADEPAYYLASLSLAHDGDLRCEIEDLERLFAEYPYLPVANLILATRDGWRTLYFGKPYLFPLLAAPLAVFLGAKGLVAFNMLLLVAMIWMGTIYLRRFNADGTAALFSVGFFLLSATFSYVFWLQPELLNMFATMGCLFFAFHTFEDKARRGFWDRLFNVRTSLWWSGALLSLGVYNKPMVAAVALPIVARLLMRRQWRGLVGWSVAATATLALVASLSWALLGAPTAYLGLDRAGFVIRTPESFPEELEPLRAENLARESDPEVDPELAQRSAGWEWIFRLPDHLTWKELREDAVYFLIGRHTGIFLYQPFAVLALGLFFVYGWRAVDRWVILLAVAVVAIFLLVFISFNWHGGGGFVGNRYWIIVYPALLFLVTRIRPPALLLAGYACGALLVGPLFFAPYGAVVPSPTLQWHARHHPFQLFPLEFSLREIPGYSGDLQQDLWIYGRRDHLREIDGDIWFHGAEDNVAWLQSAQPLPDLVFEVWSPAPENRIVVELAGDRHELALGSERQHLVLRPERPPRLRWDRMSSNFTELVPIYLYRMKVRTATGELPRWRGQIPHRFYIGASFRYLGTTAEVAVAPQLVTVPPPASGG